MSDQPRVERAPDRFTAVKRGGENVLYICDDGWRVGFGKRIGLVRTKDLIPPPTDV